MSEYINKDETVKILERVRDHCSNDDMAFALNWAAETVKNMSTADVEEVKTAVFEECSNGSGFKCSRCKARVKNRAVVNETHKYCYKCGARFVGVAPIDDEF